MKNKLIVFSLIVVLMLGLVFAQGNSNKNLEKLNNSDSARIQRQLHKVQIGNSSVNCEDCNLTQTQNQSQYRVNFSNGRNAQVKIMPEVASKKAIERLRLKVCNESNNCSIELRSVGEGNSTKAAYEIRAQKSARVFGLFRSKMNLESRIDAETGEVLNIKKPWWAFLASEE